MQSYLTILNNNTIANLLLGVKTLVKLNNVAMLQARVYFSFPVYFIQYLVVIPKTGNNFHRLPIQNKEYTNGKYCVKQNLTLHYWICPLLRKFQKMRLFQFF